MVTCIQCGNALPEGETTCSRCGASAATGSSPEEPAPAGTWSEGDTGEHPRIEGRASSPSVLAFRETAQRTDDRPEDAPPLRPERIVRDPDLTPVPGLAVALASQPRPREEESTGTRPTIGGKARPMGQVVPLRREPRTGDAERVDDARRVAEAAQSAAVTAPAAPPAVEEAPAAERADTSVRVRTEGAEASGARPPVLASECLREDLTPTEPGRATLRWVAAVLGVVGAAVVVPVGGATGFALIEGALLAAIAALGLSPMRYELRAGGVTVLGIVGLALAVVATGVAAVPPILAVAVTVLGAGLLFRGTYRASSWARLLVGIGIGLGLVWFVGSGTVTGLTVLDITWQSIAGAVVRLAFALLVLLSLLAFMDSSTTGGCRVWGTAILVWYAAFVMLELAVGTWPGPGSAAGGPDSLVARVFPTELAGPPSAEVAAMALAAATFVALTALAASQVLVVAAGGTARRS